MLQLLVMDEIDSLGRRPEAGDRVVSAAQSDAVQSFLAEMDGMLQDVAWDPPADLLVIGMSNRPDMIDIATKRPGRLGDLIIEMPDIDELGAVKICLVYARNRQIPFQLNGKAVSGVDPNRVRAQFIRPAVAEVFHTPVLRYATDTQRNFDVTAGQLMVGAHYEAAMNRAKNRAANRRILGAGAPGIRFEDVVDSLFAEAASVAASMQADPLMLVRQLQIKVPVATVQAVPREQIVTHAFMGSEPAGAE
jgi:SpoVK/Ycf46/Vps4 family AAA+-type ATPase